MTDTDHDRGLPLLESIGRDVRYAIRSLRRSVGFTTVVVVTLALGIGANTAVFSFMNATLLRPVPFPDGDRLVALWFTPLTDLSQRGGTNALGYFTLRDHNQTFEAVGAARLTSAFNVGEETAAATGR